MNISFATAVSPNKVDKSGFIPGVSVITAGVEAKGHKKFTDKKTLESVLACVKTYGAVKVKAGHDGDFDKIVGSLGNFRISGDQVLADLQLLQSHPLFQSTLEICRMMPESIGMSISFSFSSEEIEGKAYVRCTELYSVDLVSSPAANPRGLFSSVPLPITRPFEPRTIMEEVAHITDPLERARWYERNKKNIGNIYRQQQKQSGEYMTPSTPERIEAIAEQLTARVKSGELNPENCSAEDKELIDEVQNYHMNPPPSSKVQLKAGSIMAQYAAIQDPLQRARFYAQHAAQFAEARNTQTL
jgi:hypothetical protein